jgi:uncharacterized protein YecE (DUF72 family)
MGTRLETLLNKVAVVLFQLPPRFEKNGERLTSFLDMLPIEYRYSIGR